MKTDEMVRCPACGKEGIRRGLLGGACTACGKTPRDRAMDGKVYGQATYMVRCCTVKDGQPCPGMIDIPVSGKGQCPKCGCVRGLAEYRAERGKIRVKSPVEALGVKN